MTSLAKLPQQLLIEQVLLDQPLQQSSIAIGVAHWSRLTRSGCRRSTICGFFSVPSNAG